MVTTVTHTRR